MFLCQTVSNGAIYGIGVRKSFPSKGFMLNFAVDANIINKKVIRTNYNHFVCLCFGIVVHILLFGRWT